LRDAGARSGPDHRAGRRARQPSRLGRRPGAQGPRSRARRPRPRGPSPPRAARARVRQQDGGLRLMSTAWILLLVAGLFEVGWAIGLKYTDGFTRLGPTVATAASMIVSLWLLGLAMRSIPVGTAYGVWVGVGSVGTVVLGIVLFGEPAS